MKIKLLIICLCVVVAAVGGKMSVDFSSVNKPVIENNESPKASVPTIELTNIDRKQNEN